MPSIHHFSTMSVSKNNYSMLIKQVYLGVFHFNQAIRTLEYSSWKEYVLIVAIVEFRALTEFSVLKPHSFTQLTETPKTQSAVSIETYFLHHPLYIYIFSRAVMVSTFLCLPVIISFASLKVGHYSSTLLTFCDFHLTLKYWLKYPVNLKSQFWVTVLLL